MDVSKKKLFGGCPHDCPDTCAMLYEVEDNKLLSVKGNPDHPMTRGGLCVKVKNYEERHYHLIDFYIHIKELEKRRKKVSKN